MPHKGAFIGLLIVCPTNVSSRSYLANMPLVQLHARPSPRKKRAKTRSLMAVLTRHRLEISGNHRKQPNEPEMAFLMALYNRKCSTGRLAGSCAADAYTFDARRYFPRTDPDERPSRVQVGAE